MNTIPRSRAFTLIELLVVVVIIMALTTVVLVSLSSARGRGNDTGVKADLGTIQVQATLYYGLANTYGAANTGPTASCTAGTSASPTVFNDPNTTVDDMIGTALTAAAKDAKGNTVVCRSTSSAFLVAGQLANSHYWCIDSVGSAVEEAAQPGNAVTKCP